MLWKTLMERHLSCEDTLSRYGTHALEYPFHREALEYESFK